MASPAQLAPGTVFARDFRVLRPLAEGGMGAVYEVQQLSTAKPRALKVMHPKLVADPKSRERFELEARAASRIESDHVVEVVGAGVDEGTGIAWIAMELLQGQTLADAVAAAGRLGRAEAIEVIQQLWHAMAAAHRAGLVHRDLKPENVFLTAPRRQGVPFTVKVLDFGIAKVTSEAQLPSTTTSAIGSPLWMAPEQTSAGRVGAQTDVWALGLLAFYVFTGRYYWVAANRAQGNLQALLVEILIEPLEAPSSRAVQWGSPGTLPPGFDPWFARCVARDIMQRFPDAHEALGALLALVGVHVERQGASMRPSFPSGVGASVPPPSWGPTGLAGTLPVSTWSAAPPATWQGAQSLAPQPGYAGYAPVAPPPRQGSSRAGLIVAGLAGAVLASGGVLAAMRYSRDDPAPTESAQGAEAPPAPALPTAPMVPNAGAIPAGTAYDPRAVPVTPGGELQPGAAQGQAAPVAVESPAAAPVASAERAPSAVRARVASHAESGAGRAEPASSARAVPERAAPSAPSGATGFVGGSDPARASAPGGGSVAANPRAASPAVEPRAGHVSEAPAHVDTAGMRQITYRYVEECWAGAQRRTPGHPAETVRITFSVSSITGRAFNVTVTGAHDTPLGWCIGAGLQRHEFARPEEHQTFTTRVTMTPD